MKTETKPIPVRLTQAMLDRLDHAAKETGLANRTAVVKLCLVLFLDALERNRYRIPGVNVEELIRDLDGRTHRYAETTSDVKMVAERPKEAYAAKRKGKAL